MPVPSSINDLSTTAGSNYPAGSESPITADDYFRAHAAFIAQLRDGLLNYADSIGGTANAITGTITPSPTSYIEGKAYYLVAANTNTGGVTVNFNSIGAVAVTKRGANALVAGDIVAGQAYVLLYDGTQFQIINQSIPFFDGGTLINGSLTASVAASALTIALKTAAGADPTATEPVYVAFRNATAGTGTVLLRKVSAALSITIPSTATMGQANAVAARLWVALLDNAGTVELAAMNTQLGGGQIAPVNESILITSTTLGTGSDSAGVWYSTTGRSNVPMRLLGYVENTQATAGTWATTPSVIQTMGPGVRKPGETVQIAENYTGAVATGTTILPGDDTIPQITEGNEYMTQAVTPTSAINSLHIEALANLATSAAAGTGVLAALFQDATAGALRATNNTTGGAGYMNEAYLSHRMAAGTTSSTTFRLRAGASVANTTTFNGIGGARLLGGVLNSFMRVTEVMA